MTCHRPLAPTFALAAALVLGAGLSAAPAWAADEADKGFSLGLEGHSRTTLADVGLPGYPGALPYRDNEDDKSAVSLGAWAGAFGMRLHVLKFQSDDAPERVAAFYARALARHGQVLDCRDPAARVKPPKEESTRLSCDGGAPKAGEFEYRVGTSRNFRVVHVKPWGQGGARFEMVKMVLGS